MNIKNIASSIWEKEALLYSDILIVGGGITGLSTAISLKEKAPQLRVKLIDASWFAQGASTRNAGFACFGSLTELLDDVDNLGLEGMVALVKKRWHGLQKLQSRLGKGAIGFTSVGGYELLRGDGSQDAALDNMEIVNEALETLFEGAKVFRKLTGLSHSHRFGAPYDGPIIFNPLEGHLHSGKMMHALFTLATRHGVEIHTGLALEKYVEQPKGGVLVHCSYGSEGKQIQMETEKLVLCTNAFTQRLLPEMDMRPGRGVIVLTEEVEEGLPFQGSYHYDRGYFYFRDFGKRIMFGGARNLFFEQEQTTSMEVPENVIAMLESHLRKIILPTRSVKIEMAWSGVMAFGPVKEPLVGKLSPNVFGGFRLGGMGVAIGSSIGEELADYVLHTETAPLLMNKV